MAKKKSTPPVSSPSSPTSAAVKVRHTKSRGFDHVYAAIDGYFVLIYFKGPLNKGLLIPC